MSATDEPTNQRINSMKRDEALLVLGGVYVLSVLMSTRAPMPGLLGDRKDQTRRLRIISCHPVTTYPGSHRTLRPYRQSSSTWPVSGREQLSDAR